jgi:hypothetical protein
MNRTYAVVGLGIAAAWAGLVAIAGPLNPPAGPVTPTNKTLQEIYDKPSAADPRIAINATNTPGDPTSLFTIYDSGSYYLTGNIDGVTGKNGITIDLGVKDVTIDLNGFAMRGVPGSLDGITCGNGVRNVTIRNGTIRGWDGSGIDLGTRFSSADQVVGVTASNNGAKGISIGDGAVTNCIASNNTGAGINASFFALITGCESANNTGDGIAVFSGSTITACNVASNNGNGISGGNGSTITNCNLRGNLLDGIVVSSECTVLNNGCTNNGLGANIGAGVHALGGDNRIEGNNCVNADRGIHVEGFGNFIFRNSCSGNTTANWSIVANNVYGPIIDRHAPASPAASGDAAASTLNSAEPNANFTY